MIRFDYLHAARPLLIRRILELRLPVAWRAPLFALISAVLITCAAWGIEAYRFATAVAMEAQSRDRYEESRLEVTRVKVLYAHVERMSALARRVRDIQSSGDLQARFFANLGNHLPAHVWLTSISSDDAGLSISGGAADFTRLGRAFARLAMERDGYAPVLVRATRDARTTRTEPLAYEIHLSGPR